MLKEKSKIMYHQKRVLEWLEGEHVAPITIDCALTRRCNLKCEYCYSQLQDNPGGFSQKQFFRFLDDCQEMGVKGVSLVSDGESTCIKWWYKAVIYGSVLGLDMALGTNGVLITQKQIDECLADLVYLRFNVSAGTHAGYARIHGVGGETLDTVTQNIRMCVTKRDEEVLDTTIGMQMVLMPHYANEVLPLCNLAVDLGVDYLVLKHCSDDEDGSLGVDYEGIKGMRELLKAAEKKSTEKTKIIVKWRKIRAGKKKPYRRCYGPQFIPQISGSGLIAPCGMFFNSKYKEYHMGYIQDGFKQVWNSQRTKNILKKLHSDQFNARHNCGHLCLQHDTNRLLDKLKANPTQPLKFPKGEPEHVNFI